MIKEYVDAWFRNRDKLKKYFETHTQEQYGQNYTDMLKTIIKVIINDPEEILDEEIEKMIEDRQAARKAKDFAKADAIRDELLAKGIVLEDTREGVKWKRA